MANPIPGTAVHDNSAFNVVAQAERTALAVSNRAGLAVRVVEEMSELRDVSRLFESVWGRSSEGVPINTELLRSLVHAGGCATAAFDDSGAMVGAAALAVAAPQGATYSLIAAAAPGSADRGIGHAVKLHQRAWALGHGYNSMMWTFDPLVSRNARFNLAKLGAEAHKYATNFYGQMNDEINGTDEADRLVATWVLGSRRAIAASEGTAADPTGPTDGAQVLAAAPDGEAMLQRDAQGLWVRVPDDIVSLRRADPVQSEGWRHAAREVLVEAFDEGLVATHMTRHGWYLLTAKDKK